MSQWIFVIGTATIFILCDAISAFWARTGNHMALAGICVLAPLGYYLFGILNKQISLSVSSGLVNVFLLTGAILFGVFIFHDHLTSKQIAGLFFATITIFLLS